MSRAAGEWAALRHGDRNVHNLDRSHLCARFQQRRNGMSKKRLGNDLRSARYSRPLSLIRYLSGPMPELTSYSMSTATPGIRRLALVQNAIFMLAGLVTAPKSMRRRHFSGSAQH